MFSLPFFFFLFAKRLKGREEKNYLFVLSNLIYVIYQTDRLFGKPDGPRLKSSVFPTCEKLCQSGHVREACCMFCGCLSHQLPNLVCPGSVISCPRPNTRVKGQKEPRAPAQVWMGTGPSQTPVSQLFSPAGFQPSH